MKTINEQLPLKAKLMLLNTDPIAYYVQREIYQEGIFQDYTVREKLNDGPSALIHFLEEQGITHILTDETRTQQAFSQISLSQEYHHFKRQYLSVHAQEGSWILYRIN